MLTVADGMRFGLGILFDLALVGVVLVIIAYVCDAIGGGGDF
jgi:hypothetical protein